MSEKVLKSAKIKLGLSLFWFLFTFSLVVWWWIFSFHQLELLAEVVEAEKYQSLRRMLLWEGAVLVSAVFFGGLVLVVLTRKEQMRNLTLRNFFSNFTHDLKTSLTRLRLRTELLAEEGRNANFQKLLEEVSRLDLQLENSLWVARGETQKLLKEKIRLSSIIGYLRIEWPELQIQLLQDAVVEGDEQALKSVFRNLFQNSWLHGDARNIIIKPQTQKHLWSIEINDDGKGFKGDVQLLGAELLKSKNELSNGLGLYLTRDLVERMRGSIEFVTADKGFKVILNLPSAEVTNG